MLIASAHALAFYDATISLICDIEQNVNSCQSLGSYWLMISWIKILQFASNQIPAELMTCHYAFRGISESKCCGFNFQLLITGEVWTFFPLHHRLLVTLQFSLFLIQTVPLKMLLFPEQLLIDGGFRISGMKRNMNVAVNPLFSSSTFSFINTSETT